MPDLWHGQRAMDADVLHVASVRSDAQVRLQDWRRLPKRRLPAYIQDD